MTDLPAGPLRQPWFKKTRAAAIGFGLGATLALSPLVWAQNPPAAGPIGSFPTYTQTAATIFVGVPLVPGPGPGNAFSPTGTPVAAASASYCITLLATEPLSGRQGSTIVVVSQSP